jgi:plasmid maintenance system antidote protein VapI
MKPRDLSPSPTKYRLILRENDVAVSHLAAYLGLSYPHILNVLNGISRLTPSVKKRLDSFVEELQTKGEGD